MAAPADKTIQNLSGTWVMNKTLSDSSNDALALQGIGYLTRKGISLATITLTVNQFEAPPTAPSTETTPVTHIDLDQSASGLSTTHEARCLDNVFREHSDWLFGDVKGQSQWVTLDEITDEHLKKGWEIEGDGKFVRSHVERVDNSWTATQIWGFQVINGERRYCRNIVVKKVKDNKRVELRLVYDYVSA